MIRLALLLVPAAGILTLAAAEGSLPSPLTLIIPLIVISILVLVNGLYVAAEFSIIAARPTQIDQLAQEGHGPAVNVQTIQDSRAGVDRYIATAQLGITIASLGLAMYGEPRISHFLEPYMVAGLGMSEEASRTVGFLVALGLLTYFHVVIGEMIPKALALTNPTKVVMSLYRPMQISSLILKYPVLFLNAIGNGLLKIFRIPVASPQERLIGAEELELIILESAEGGLIDDEEEEIIRNIFDFSERTVEQVMSPRRKVQTLPLDAPKDELLETVTVSRYSRFPVYDGDLDHIVGILHLKDLIKLTLNSETHPFDLRLILRSVPEIPEDYQVEKLLARFKNKHLHMAIVRDEFGGLAGVVTLEDLVEEVVGEVRDEFDMEREPYVELGPGSIEVEGDYLLDDLAEDMVLGEDEDLPDVETVGGLIITLLGRPPTIGDVVEFKDDIQFTVLDVDGLAVTRVRIEFSALPSENNDSSGSAEA